MKVIYDPESDTLTMILKDVPVSESDESKPGVILDYDSAGDIVSMEILDASKRVSQVRNIEFQTVAAIAAR